MSHENEIATIFYHIEGKGDNAEYVIESANQAALDLFRVTPKEMVGHRMEEFVVGDDYKQLSKLRGKIFLNNPLVKRLPVFRFSFKRNDGTEFTADVQTTRQVFSMFIHPRDEV